MFTSSQLGIHIIRDRELRAADRTSLSDLAMLRLCSLSATDRYDYTLGEICVHQELWVFFDPKGLVTLLPEPERVPIFPHEGLASRWLEMRTLPDAKPVPIPIHDYLDVLTPQIIDRRYVLDVFPSNDNEERLCVSIDDFVFDLVGRWESQSGTELKVAEEVRKEFVAWGKSILRARQRNQINRSTPPKLP